MCELLRPWLVACERMSIFMCDKDSKELETIYAEGCKKPIKLKVEHMY